MRPPGVKGTPEQAKKFRTESGRNVRRKLAFDELKNERDLKQKGPSSKPCNASEGSSEESEVSCLHGSDEGSEDKSDLDLSSVDEDSESRDSASSSLERSSDESGPENFGVDEVTKSQELPPLFQLNPGEEQLFLVLVFEIIMRIIMGASWEGNDSRFKKAQTYWEKLINTTKESLVASIKWRDYKEKLKKCEVVKFVPLKPTTERQKCEACSMSCFLTKRVVCDEEPDGPDGEVKQEFEVCRSCADKGHVYHKLHHYKQQLKESCFKKINIVKQMTGTEKPRRIVKKCLDDKRWLDWLFSNFQSTLNAADRWAVDGSKTLAMKKY